MNKIRNIGFIGLGRMGSGISRNLIEQGYALTVYDINPSSCKTFETMANIAKSKADLLKECDLIFLSLPGSVQVEETVEVFIQNGIAGKTIIDLSTSYPFSSQMLYDKVTQAGGRFADASLTGTPVHADQGALIVTYGGDQETFEECRPVIDSFASRGVHYIGGPGAGNLAKLTNNYLSIMYIGLYSEIFPLAEKMGFDIDKLFEIIGQSGVNCALYQTAGAKIVRKTYEPSFSLDFALKDITYVKKLFDEYQVPSFILEGGLNLLRLAHIQGLGEKDLTEMAKVVRQNLGNDEGML